MRKSKKTNLILVWMVLNMTVVSGLAQIPVELSAGHSGYYYQHSFAAQFNPEQPVGFFHTSSLLLPFDKNRGNEIMSQSYVTYALSERWSSGIGSIYTPVNQVRPSIFVQYFQKEKSTSVLVFPRVDIWSEPNFELMGFIDYRGTGNQRIKIYARFQYMTTWNQHGHVRSYQYARAGIDTADFQFGLAANLDQYGRDAANFSNFGLFLRKEFY